MPDDGRGESGSPLSGMRLTELIGEEQERLAAVARSQERIQHLLDAFLDVSEQHGGFTAEDEAVLTALAGAAGAAIDNARLYEEGEVRRRWLAAVSDVRATLLEAPSPQDALAVVAARVVELTEADAAWVMVGPDPTEGTYEISVQQGDGLEDVLGAQVRPSDSVVLGPLESSGSRVVFLDLTGVDHSGPNAHADWGPCLGFSLEGSYGRVVVSAARRAGRPAFDQALAPLVTAFADQCALALDTAARQRLARQLDVYEDRDRIARDLHDLVVQRVFAAGLTLQSVLPLVRDDDVQRRVRSVIGQLDDTVRDIRTTIFDLHTVDADEHADSTRRRLADAVAELTGDRLRSTVRMSGAVDTLLTGALAADVEAVLREAVSNATRHSGGSHVTVTLDVADEVVLEVVDDGRGVPDHVARSGLRNLEERAQARGGTCAVEALAEGGTRLRWCAPLVA